MYIILCKNGTIGSRLLRAIMWSRWSHSAIYDEESDTVWDSTFWQGGVKKFSFAKWAEHYPDRELRPIQVDTNTKHISIEWLNAQLGKKYDFTALLSLPFQKRNWQEDDSWFCSELTETYRHMWSKPIFRVSASRITPHHQDIVIGT